VHAYVCPVLRTFVYTRNCGIGRYSVSIEIINWRSYLGVKKFVLPVAASKKLETESGGNFFY